ncbi:Ppx/GppA phosphatase family protein [Megasphaera vaginalis (ex Srinivasan et al. 2021)]|uniref:Ppx/GppA phosphatase family protein n=1 Tax=Megasphaera vaginalis (ex Srinivasan et al. 2021) TaxID=1111454 RepID=U7UGE8_9FIRM|nr:Ppx/GppA phosphatase [Megasphaera vaginalis (ex Srinivasan et al. 2021)]ERT58386.1 Ppx/GppA phosphatase family protein [Megasphaera vaginalis (ex Srinivasan et al. 2021)]
MEDSKKNVFGIIRIGTVNMDLKIVSYSTLADRQTIENVSREVHYGEEVVTTHRISFQALNEICTVLNGFRQLLRDYQVDDVKVVTTTSLRDAENQLNAIDQIRIRTGFSVDIVHMAEEIYYKFFGLYYDIDQGAFNFGRNSVLLMDMTSSCLGLTCWKEDKILFQQNVHIGALGLMGSFTEKERNGITFTTTVREYIYGTLSPLWRGVQQYDIQYLILSGQVAVRLGLLMGKKLYRGVGLIAAREFCDFVDSFSGITPFKLCRYFSISENMANVLMPIIMLYYELLRHVDVQMIVLMDMTFTEGYSIHYLATKLNDPYLTRQRWMLLELARGIAVRYVSAPDHSRLIEEFCATIFNALFGKIGVDRIGCYLLRLAAIMHEWGKFVNLRKCDVCAYDLILTTDLFAISDEEKKMVANVAYFSYFGKVQERDDRFASLQPETKVMVAKLVAIFCLADALDKGHNGKIKSIEAALHDNLLEIAYTSDFDVSLEKWAFMKIVPYFEEVFGMTPVLKRGR